MMLSASRATTKEFSGVNVDAKKSGAPTTVEITSATGASSLNLAFL